MGLQDTPQDRDTSSVSSCQPPPPTQPPPRAPLRSLPQPPSHSSPAELITDSVEPEKPREERSSPAPARTASLMHVLTSLEPYPNQDTVPSSPQQKPPNKPNHPPPPPPSRKRTEAPLPNPT